MKLEICLLIIQIGYILAKSINASPCKNHTESLRIARSEEKTTITPEDVERNSEFVFETTSVLKANDNNYEKLPKITANFNGIHSRRFLVNKNNHPDNLVKWPSNLNKIENKNKANSAPVTYQAIDPKNIFVYGLYPPKFTKNVLRDNDSTHLNNPKVNKTDYNDLNKNRDKEIDIQTNDTQIEFRNTNRNSEVTNIRELRQHLLDHLLDYFLNIIIEDNYHNVTRKKNNNDVMKVENKLRNYYGPQTDVLELDDENVDDYDNNNYRRNSDDETEEVLNKDDEDEKNITDKETLDTMKNDTEIENVQLLWQPTNKNPVYIDEISNTTIMIPIIEDYDDSLEIAAPTRNKKIENNDANIETTETSHINLDNIATTTEIYDMLHEIKPINVSENVTDDYLYINEEESTEKLVFEDFPDSDDYFSIENDTSVSVTDKAISNENITDFSNEEDAKDEIPVRRTLNDDSVLNSEENINETRKSASKNTPLISKNRELNEKIVIVTSQYSDEQELAIKVKNKKIKNKKSRKSSQKQKKDGRNSKRNGCRKNFVLNLNIKLV